MNSSYSCPPRSFEKTTNVAVQDARVGPEAEKLFAEAKEMLVGNPGCFPAGTHPYIYIDGILIYQMVWLYVKIYHAYDISNYIKDIQRSFVATVVPFIRFKAWIVKEGHLKCSGASTVTMGPKK